jgi:hypothetical protein
MHEEYQRVPTEVLDKEGLAEFSRRGKARTEPHFP